jgi:hypothetical protein
MYRIAFDEYVDFLQEQEDEEWWLFWELVH